ncbi:hypothetical protein [Streptomyces sp. NPDC050759]|uniref:hypothetical protein n=1 Tax=Streptomyces sp. NPDC050759 TaxID=3365635 RepID=UPI0037BE1B06
MPHRQAQAKVGMDFSGFGTERNELADELTPLVRQVHHDCVTVRGSRPADLGTSIGVHGAA